MRDRQLADYVCVLCDRQWMGERVGDNGVPICPEDGCGGAGIEVIRRVRDRAVAEYRVEQKWDNFCDRTISTAFYIWAAKVFDRPGPIWFDWSLS